MAHGGGSSTTLFNLKDEYLKAKKEVLTVPEHATGPSKRKKIQDIIRYKHEDKAKRAALRHARDERRAAKIAMTEQEEESLRRSAAILEAKSSIYDKLASGNKSDLPETVLVDFAQKEVQNNRRNNPYDYSVKASQDNYQEQEKEDEDEVHFSNVDNGEVRTKGVGFFAFSTNANVRREQMDFLNSMRESTERSREAFLASKAKQANEKLARLNRLRRKHSLPPLEALPGSEPKDCVEGMNISGNSHDETATEEEDNLVESLEDVFTKRQRSLWEERVEELRNEREAEFAPYYEGGRYDPVVGSDEEEEHLDEDSEAIINFISTVRARS